MLTRDGRFGHPGKSALSKASKGHSVYMKVRVEDASTGEADLEANFLFLSSGPRKRKREDTKNDSDSDSTSEDDAHHYRSVQGKAKTSDQPEDADLLYDPEASGSEREGREHGSDEFIRSRRNQLNKAVEDNPSSCENWLHLIELQDEIIGLHHTSTEARPTKAEQRSNAEIKLSMYEKAIAAVTQAQDKEHLLVASMDEASRIWDASKILTKWRSTLRDYPGSPALWAKYLDFRAADLQSLKVDDVLTEYVDCLKTLDNLSRSTTAIRDPEAGEKLLYLVLRYTLLMREAGFAERALATWQSLLECSFFKPTVNETPEVNENSTPDKLLAFEEFWESEVPRIGEDGALGWAHYASNGGGTAAPKTDETLALNASSDPFSSLATAEKKQAMQARCPGRTIDDIVEDDPYRVILYSDVQDLLGAFSNSRPSEPYLISNLLAFCHLPSLYDTPSGNGARSVYRDPFVSGGVVGSSSAASTSAWKLQPKEGSADPMNAADPSVNDGPFSTPVADYATSTDSLFSATGSWFSLFDSWFLENSNDRGPVPIDWISRTLRLLVDNGIGGDALAVYYLALELRLSPDTVTKTAKKLLKARPTSFRLYNAHVSISFRLGQADRATQTLVAAINTSRDIAELVLRDTIFLWQTWVWELLISGQEKEALERLLSYPDRSLVVDSTNHTANVSPDLRVTPTALLRAQQALSASLQHFISLSLPLHATTATTLLILLSYLSSSRSLPTAQTTFTTNLTTLSTRFPPTSPAHEILHQSSARLLHYHATHIPLFKPAAIREALASSIALFPQNTIFLSLYAWNEARFRIDDRVRSIIRDVVLKPTSASSRRDDDVKESITPHLFAIYSELSRSVTFGSNTNTVRNTFERAVDSPAGAHCAAIWKLYILFENRRGDKERAKAVWWRGARACPWVKGLWMMAFGELRQGMRDQELRDIWEMMGDKELRLHVDLEAELERRGGA